MLQGYTQEEIGERMGIRHPAVNALLKRAFKVLNMTFSRDFEL